MMWSQKHPGNFNNKTCRRKHGSRPNKTWKQLAIRMFISHCCSLFSTVFLIYIFCIILQCFWDKMVELPLYHQPPASCHRPALPRHAIGVGPAIQAPQWDSSGGERQPARCDPNFRMISSCKSSSWWYPQIIISLLSHLFSFIFIYVHLCPFISTISLSIYPPWLLDEEHSIQLKYLGGPTF